MNKVMLIGNVDKDPDIHYFEADQAVAQVSLATTEKGYTLPNGTQGPEDVYKRQVPDGYKGKFSRTCTDRSMLKEMKKKSNYVFLKNIFDCIEFKDEKSAFNLLQLENAAKAGLIDKKVYALRCV